MKGAGGWANFGARNTGPDAADHPALRAAFATLADGSHLLVGKDIDPLDEFARRIGIALALSAALIFALAGVASIAVTRRTVGRIEAINATSRAIMRSGLGPAHPPARHA